MRLAWRRNINYSELQYLLPEAPPTGGKQSKQNTFFLDKLKNKSYFLAHCAKTVQFAYPPYEQKAGDCWLFFRDLQNFWRSNFDISTHILQIKKLHKKSSACYQTSSLIYDKGQGGWLHC